MVAESRLDVGHGRIATERLVSEYFTMATWAIVGRACGVPTDKWTDTQPRNPGTFDLCLGWFAKRSLIESCLRLRGIYSMLHD